MLDSRQTDKFRTCEDPTLRQMRDGPSAGKRRTCKAKGGRDEDRAHSLETVRESSWVVPETGSPVRVEVSRAWTAAQHEDKCREQEDADGNEL